MVRVLSDLTGNHLNILSMNSSTDSSDFIGGFEQVFVIHIQNMSIRKMRFELFVNMQNCKYECRGPKETVNI